MKTEKELQGAAKAFKKLDDTKLSKKLVSLGFTEEEIVSVKGIIAENANPQKTDEAEVNPSPDFEEDEEDTIPDQPPVNKPSKKVKSLNGTYSLMKLVRHDGQLMEGPTIRTGVRLDAERANRLNDQEHNTMLRYKLTEEAEN
jgi:hypothetical protein